jgi:MFS family permease
MARGRVFYGWWVTVAFAVMVFLSTGVRFSVGPFLKPVVADLETDRASYSLVIALSLFLYGVFMPFVGRLVERWGARLVAVLGTLVFAVALAGTGLVTRLWQLAIVTASWPRWDTRPPGTSSARRSSRAGSRAAGRPRSRCSARRPWPA